MTSEELLIDHLDRESYMEGRSARAIRHVWLQWPPAALSLKKGYPKGLRLPKGNYQFPPSDWAFNLQMGPSDLNRAMDGKMQYFFRFRSNWYDILGLLRNEPDRSFPGQGEETFTTSLKQKISKFRKAQSLLDMYVCNMQNLAWNESVQCSITLCDTKGSDVNDAPFVYGTFLGKKAWLPGK